VFLACGNLPENNPFTERSHEFAVKYARHNFFVQIRIAFPPVRRRSSLASCRICLHAGQTKIKVSLRETFLIYLRYKL
jgi:hypothetical protein